MSLTLERKLLVFIAVGSIAIALAAVSAMFNAWQAAEASATNRFILCSMSANMVSPDAWKRVKHLCSGFDIDRRPDLKKKSV